MNREKDIKDIIPKPTSGLLLKTGKEKYYAIGEMLVQENKWKSGDEIALLALCVSYQRWIQAEKEIRKQNALTFETETGYRQQIPEISIANNSMSSMLNFIKEFALTPRERSKLKEFLVTESFDEELEGMIT